MFEGVRPLYKGDVAAVHPQNEIILCGVVRGIQGLRLVELVLGALATWAYPIVGKVFEGHSVVFGWVIDIAADGTDVLAGGLELGEIHFCKYGWHGIVEIHHALGLQILIALREYR